MPAATFTPVDDVVSQATSAGFFPGRHAVDVTDVRRLSDGVFRLTFRDGYIAAHAKAAQFVNLFSHDSMMLMPRPFGVSEVRDDLVSVIFAVVGKGTQEFSRLHAGDRIDVLGPLGRPFNTKRDAHYLLVGGGLGVPPLIYAAQRLQASGKSHSTAVFGYRNVHFADEIVSPYAHRTLSIDESEGNVITLLDRMESQGELAAGGVERRAVVRPAADDESGGPVDDRAGHRMPAQHGAAHGMRIRHMRDLRGRYGRRAQQGVL